MLEELYTASPPHGLRNGQNAARKNSTPEGSRRYSPPSDARSLAAMRLVAVSIISKPTASVCAIQSSTPKACALPPALSRPDAKWPLARASNAPVCTGPNKAPTPSLLSAVQNSVVVFKISGSADQNAGPHDPSLSWRAPPSSELGRLQSDSLADKCLRGERSRGRCQFKLNSRLMARGWHDVAAS